MAPVVIRLEPEPARSLARGLISSSGLLGYVGGRYTRTHLDEPEAQSVRQAIGAVMGGTYDLLYPIWLAYPELDPGRWDNPLAIDNTHPPPDEECSLAAVLQCLNQLAESARTALPVLVAAVEDPHCARAYAELEAAVGALRIGLRRGID